MVHPHPWFECRPALLALDGTTENLDPHALGITKVQQYWARMSDAERHRFHKFTCEQDVSPATLTVIAKMRVALGDPAQA